MADRSATSAVLTEMAKSQNQPFHMIQVEFEDTDGDPVIQYITDAWRDITWDGNTYTALGHFMGFSDIEETSELAVNSIDLQLSGVDQVVVSEVLNYRYIDRPVKIYKGFFDANMAVIADPVLIFDGRMDSPVIEENPDDGTCSVTITATNAWVDFERLSGRHTNHEEQQIFFPGDKGFEFASEVIDEITWGRAS